MSCVAIRDCFSRFAPSPRSTCGTGNNSYWRSNLALLTAYINVIASPLGRSNLALLAQHTSASLTILHVVEAIYFKYPTAVQIQTHWQELLSTDTPQARNLNLAVEIAEAAGIPVEIKVHPSFQ